MELGLKDI